MNSDNIILRETTFSPLVNKNDFITAAEFDANFTNIYSDLVALCVTSGVLDYNAATLYDDTIVQFSMYGSRLYRFIFATPTANVTPGTVGAENYWLEIFPTDLAHRKNSDTILAQGTANEVTAAEIKAFIVAGLTTTTNLTISEKTSTSFKLNSSTGADVVIPQANEKEAGLLTAVDKVKLQQLSGNNSGDQTLGGLGGEPTANKATNFSEINHVLFPTVEAVETRLTEKVEEINVSSVSSPNTLLYFLGGAPTTTAGHIALSGTPATATQISINQTSFLNVGTIGSDDNSVAWLTSIKVGDTIQLSEVGSPFKFATYLVTSVNDGGDYYYYDLTPVSSFVGEFTADKYVVINIIRQSNSLVLPTYADNAAAIAGGLTVNKIYKTATGELRIVI